MDKKRPLDNFSSFPQSIKKLFRTLSTGIDKIEKLGRGKAVFDKHADFGRFPLDFRHFYPRGTLSITVFGALLRQREILSTALFEKMDQKCAGTEELSPAGA